MENENPEKQRHGCVTAWLIFVMIANAVVSFFYLAGEKMFDLSLAPKMERSFVVLAVLGVLNILFAFALLNWKFWGFFGFVTTTLLSFLISLNAGVSPWYCIPGLAGLFFLFAVLQIRRNDVSAWDQMEKRKPREERPEE